MKRILAQISFGGFVLSGGNDLAVYGGDAPERDEVEQYLIETRLPVICVCRGMQSLQHYYQIPLEPVKGHVRFKQTIQFSDREEEVNSYHNWGTTQTSEELEVLARSQDNVVKAVKHRNLPQLGIMWHPERMLPFRQQDIDMFQNHFRSLK